GEGSGTPTEPHHTPFPKAQEEEIQKLKERVQVLEDREEEEIQGMIDSLDKSNETIAKYLQEYQEFASELPLEKKIELISDLVKYQEHYTKVHKFQSQQRKPMTKKQKREYYMDVIKSNLGWRFKDFKGMTFEEIEVKFVEVWKQVEDFIPMGSKEESERLKRKGLNLEKEQVKKQKSSEEPPEIETTTKEFTEDKIKEIMQLVPVEDVYVQALQVKHPIIDWKVKALKKKIDEVQLMIDGDPNNSALREMGVDALKEYSVALDDEEKLLINRSIVGEIWSEDNVRYSGDQIPSQFVNHFKNFLGVQSSKECLELDHDLFSNKISEQEAISMIEEVTNEEVKAAMFNIDDNKALGPDGFTAKFYKKAWHVVENDVCEAVKELFTKGKLLGELNATLITLVPKVSTPTKKKIKKDNSFKYHHGCKSLEITHLCFADDLLVMGHGDVNSVNVIKKALDTFSNVSGLHPNLIYWAFIFKLLKTVMKDIEKLFKGFCGVIVIFKKGKAKVTWKDVCQPKENGGLGLKPLEEWNKALLVKHIWNMAAKKDSLWVKWINIVKLKGRSVWEVDKQSSDSWMWKNLLELRDEVRSHMQYKIGNGRTIFIWHDNWTSLPILDSFISKREIYAAGLSNDDTIIDCISDSRWKWPVDRLPNSQLYTCTRQHKLDNSLYLRVLLEGLSFVKGGWSGWTVYDEGNRECMKDGPSWSLQYTVTGG
nr:RNA-directed DNA polymerase, eukaryota, reverse transcriptase zinc-binding domain protein [Tanacetum cinerariifolium]